MRKNVSTYKWVGEELQLEPQRTTQWTPFCNFTTRAVDIKMTQQSQDIRIGSRARYNVCSVQSWVEDWLSCHFGYVSYMDELWCGLPTGLDEG
jgi:hypothetical protein